MLDSALLVSYIPMYVYTCICMCTCVPICVCVQTHVCDHINLNDYKVYKIYNQHIIGC